MNPTRTSLTWTHWLLRIALASVFLYHGITKFPAAAGLVQMLGMPVFLVYLLALMETLGGLLILVGGLGSDLATRLGGLLLAPVMIGAIAKVHWGQWSFVASPSHPMGGMEFQFVLLSLAVYFLLRGNGPLRTETPPTV